MGSNYQNFCLLTWKLGYKVDTFPPQYLPSSKSQNFSIYNSKKYIQKCNIIILSHFETDGEELEISRTHSTSWWHSHLRSDTRLVSNAPLQAAMITRHSTPESNIPRSTTEICEAPRRRKPIHFDADFLLFNLPAPFVYSESDDHVFLNY